MREPDNLPEILAELETRWQLEILAAFDPGGECAWVAPARRRGAENVVVKIGWPHPEAEHEADGLAFWNGDGAVRLLDLATVGESPVLLLERCEPGDQLSKVLALDDQDEVVAGLLLRLWREPEPGHVFRPLQQMCDLWAEGAERRLDAGAVADPGLIRAGLDLFRALPQDAEREVVLFTDLHGGNILSAQREPWLAIDPKPYVGDPTYDALQHMLNVGVVVDPVGYVRRMAALLKLDPARLGQWLFARICVEAVDIPELGDVASALAPRQI